MEGASRTAPTFGAFRILSRLGRGGMAETFLVEKQSPGGVVQQFCLKRILPEMSKDPEWIRFFQKEARTVAKLRHPNVVSVSDVGVEQGIWWMLLELVDGTDLRSLLATLRANGQLLSREMAWYITIEVARALVHAHSRRLPDGTPEPVVHRDVSPSNVLISREGSVKLADFGIARVPNEERTRSGIVRGKMSYMAPEQASGDPCDGRADLFSVGVMLHEMLTGYRPYDGRTEAETAMNLGRGQRVQWMWQRDFPMYPICLVDELLELDVDRRIASAEKLLEYLVHLTPPGNTYLRLAELVRSVPPNHDEQVTAPDVGGRGA